MLRKLFAHNAKFFYVNIYDNIGKNSYISYNKNLFGTFVVLITALTHYLLYIVLFYKFVYVIIYRSNQALSD